MNDCRKRTRVSQLMTERFNIGWNLLCVSCKFFGNFYGVSFKFPAHWLIALILAVLPYLFCRLVGDMLIDAAFLTFLGSFNSEYREQLLRTWSTQIESGIIPHTPNYNMLDEMTDPISVRSFWLAPIQTCRVICKLQFIRLWHDVRLLHIYIMIFV